MSAESRTLEAAMPDGADEVLARLGAGLSVLERQMAEPARTHRPEDDLLLTTLALSLERLARDTDDSELTDEQRLRLADASARIREVIEELGRHQTAGPAVAVPAVARPAEVPAAAAPGPRIGARRVTHRAPLDRTALKRRVGRAMLVAGSILVMFLFFEFFLSGLAESRSQRVMLREFRHGLQTGSLGSLTKVPVEGSAVSLLEIPSIGLRQVVVQGSSPELLKEGPGHLPNTPLPGEFGNSVILGHRLAYGAPFGGLDQLRSGDDITLITGQGSFTYTVSKVMFVDPGQPDVVGPTLDSRLTLVTSGSSPVPNDRFAVEALLQGNPLGVPRRPSVAVGQDQLGQNGNVTGVLLACLWALVLLAVIMLMRRLYARWPSRAAYLVTTPLVLMLLWLVFENLDRVLPGTL